MRSLILCILLFSIPALAQAAEASKPAAKPVADSKVIALPGYDNAVVTLFDASTANPVLFIHVGAATGFPIAQWIEKSRPDRVARGVKCAVLMVGHGSGTKIWDIDIESFLKTQKNFLETLGGTHPAATIDLFGLASCNPGDIDQMGMLRRGLGYLPVRRVVSYQGASVTGLTSLAALGDVLAQTSLPALGYRARYTFVFPGNLRVASLGEVDNGSAARGALKDFTVTQDALGWPVLTPAR